jgi:hypothetical protein
VATPDEISPHRKPRWILWQFGLGTLLLLIVYCAALLAAARWKMSGALLPLGETLALDWSMLLYVLGGFGCCVAAAGIALSEGRAAKQRRSLIALAGGWGGAVGGMGFALIMRTAMGAESFEPTGIPLWLQVVCWAGCGWLAGIATQLAAAAFRERRRGRRDLPATFEGDRSEFDVRPAALQVAEPRSPPLRVSVLKRSGLSAWATSVFLHFIALWMVAICFVPFSRTEEEEWLFRAAWIELPEPKPVDHLARAAAVPVRPPKMPETPAKPHTEPPLVSSAGDEKISVNGDLLFGRRSNDPVLSEGDGGTFSFNVYSPTVLNSLNRLCQRLVTKPDKDASIAVVATSLTKNPKSGEPCHFSIKVQNSGKVQLTDLFVLAEFGKELSIEAADFGGIAMYKSDDVVMPNFVARNGGSSGTNLIAFDYGPNRLIRHARALQPGEWVQFVVAVRPKRLAKFNVRAAVISEQDAAAQTTTMMSVRE